MVQNGTTLLTTFIELFIYWPHKTKNGPLKHVIFI